MDMSGKELRNKIREYKNNIKLEKEKKENLKSEIKEKKKEIMRVRQEYYDKLSPEEKDKENIKSNEDILHKIFSFYKSINDYNRQKNSIEENLEQIKESNSRNIQKMHNKVNSIYQQISEKDTAIQKANRDFDKYTKSADLVFDIENYVINPGIEFTNAIAELVLGNQVHRKLRYLLKYTIKQNASIKEEIDQYKKVLSHLKKEKGIEEESDEEEEEEEEESEEHKSEKSNKEETEEKKNNNNHLGGDLEKIDERIEENYPSEIVDRTKTAQEKEESIKEEDKDNEAIEDTTGSIVLDSIGLTPRNLERFIESPRFIDKVASVTKVIKPIKLDLDIDDKCQLASVIKVRHVEKTKETIENLVAQIEASKATIEDLQKELNKLNKKNKEMNIKKSKLLENIEYTANKIEILIDQKKLIQDQANNVDTVQQSPISGNSTNKKIEEIVV